MAMPQDHGKRRLQAMLSHLQPCPAASENPDPPPAAALREGSYFPTMAHLKEDAAALGDVFRYQIFGGRHITVVADPTLFDVVFKPDELSENEEVGDAVKMEMDKIAYAWFNIPKTCGPHTRPGLNAVRSQLTTSSEVGGFNDRIAAELVQIFGALPDSGEIDGFELASSTFWPANKHLYGGETISPAICPHARDLFFQFDEPLPAITGGVPRKMFPEHVEALESIRCIFLDAIKRGVHLTDAAPVLKARVGVLAKDAAIDESAKAAFMVSLFWAAQANTLPMTFWMLREVIRNPRIRQRATDEVRNGKFASMPDPNGHYDVGTETLPYLRACLKETLRMYVAILTHRKVSRDCTITTQAGKKYKLPKDDMITVSSYIVHYDESKYPNPYEFRPERWLEPGNPSSLDSMGDKHWFPFSMGRYSCSGKFLALLEIPTLVALFLREFDCELKEDNAEANWDQVLAAVLPRDRECCTVGFSRRK
eukprot:TRINITY_DN17873_c0_g1_i1.p1 TRINITY_DN17873_c0_g1~~TRINITY_DN17873_c0_g1_i1.p1  ORF type:complete len:481 (-),score=129.63 TRINITY_DN17873_c0_g1_i1:346-1788(-)